MVWKCRIYSSIKHSIVYKLLVVNDPAEKGIHLIANFNGILTHQDDQKQILMQLTENHYKQFPNSKKH